MSQPATPAPTAHSSDRDLAESYRFALEGGLTKTVTLVRTGRRISVDIVYADGAVTDETQESFEADGVVKISITESGISLASSRTLLAGLVRLRRTRFF